MALLQQAKARRGHPDERDPYYSPRGESTACTPYSIGKGALKVKVVQSPWAWATLALIKAMKIKRDTVPA